MLALLLAAVLAQAPAVDRPLLLASMEAGAAIDVLPARAMQLDVGLEPTTAARPSYWKPFAIYAGLHGADLATTEWNRSRGGDELNPAPWMSTRSRRIAAKAVATPAMAWVDYWLQKRSPKVGRGYRIGVGVLYAVAISINASRAMNAPGKMPTAAVGR